MKYYDKLKTVSGDAMSRIALGTAGFGSDKPDSFYFNMLDRYFSLGGNTLDTAAVYGESERTLGRWLKTNSRRREDIIISTKGAHPPVSDMRFSRMNKKEITHDFENSLHDLGTGYIDIYYLHRDDISTSVCDIIDILNVFIADGRARSLGASNWTASRIEQANSYAASHRLTGFSFSQICYSPAVITPERYGDATLVCMNDAERAEYTRLGIPIMAYSSQANGFFSKNFDKPDSEITGRWASERNIKRLHFLRDVCVSHGINAAEAVIAFLTSSASLPLTIPIIGASSAGQLTESMNACGIELSADEISTLESL